MESMKNSIANSLQKQGPDESIPSDPKTNSDIHNNKNSIDMNIDESNVDQIQNCVIDSSTHDIHRNSDFVKTISDNEDEIQNINSSDKVLVLADSDNEDVEKVIRDPQPHLENEPIKTVVETLNLTLEEAFFLSYALGCLHVIDTTGQTLTLQQLWQTYCEAKSDFIELYVVYHYFRAKGWVVKTGYKFGGDYCK